MDIRSWKVIEYTRTCSLPSPLPPISLPPSLSPSLPTSLTLYISLSPPSSLAFSLDLPFVSSPSPLLHPALTLPPPRVAEHCWANLTPVRSRAQFFQVLCLFSRSSQIILLSSPYFIVEDYLLRGHYALLSSHFRCNFASVFDLAKPVAIPYKNIPARKFDQYIGLVIPSDSQRLLILVCLHLSP